MSYLRYLCLFAHSIVQHILCCIVFSVFGPNVASCSGFSILDFSNVISIFQNVSLNVEYHSIYVVTVRVRSLPEAYTTINHSLLHATQLQIKSSLEIEMNYEHCLCMNIVLGYHTL